MSTTSTGSGSAPTTCAAQHLPGQAPRGLAAGQFLDSRKTMMTDPTSPPSDENQIIAERRGKLAALRAKGQAYPNDFRRDALAADLHAAHDAKSNEELESLARTVTV